jgi:hypothetical protein
MASTIFPVHPLPQSKFGHEDFEITPYPEQEEIDGQISTRRRRSSTVDDLDEDDQSFCIEACTVQIIACKEGHLESCCSSLPVASCVAEPIIYVSP